MSISRTKRDPGQIEQYEHDELANSKRVKLVDTEMSMELSADDGDSVQIQGRLDELSPVDSSPIDISMAKEIKVYVKSLSAGQKPSLSVKISPKDSGNDFIEIATITPSELSSGMVMSASLTVLAKRVKIDGIDLTLEVTILARG